MYTMRQLSRFMIVSGAALLLAFGGAGQAMAQKVKIVLAHLPHMTGAYAAGQVGINDGFLDALELINTSHPIPGVELVGVWADAGTEVPKAMNAYKKLEADNPRPVAILGESTAVGLALKKWHMRDELPDLEGGADDEMFALPSWTFSLAGPYPNQMGGWVDYYLKNIWPKKGLSRAPRFSWLTWDNPFGRASITDKAKAYLKKQGVELVSEEFIPPVPTDTTPQLLRMKNAEVDFTFGGMYHTAYNVVLKDAEKLGMIDRIDFGLSYAIDVNSVISGVGDLARNTYITQLFTPMVAWEKEAPEALKIFQDKNRDPRNSAIWTYGFEHGLVATEIVRIAVKNVGASKVDGKAIYEAAQQLKGYTALGMAGATSFSAKKRYGLDEIIMLRLNNGKVNLLGKQKVPNLTKYEFD